MMIGFGSGAQAGTRLRALTLLAVVALVASYWPVVAWIQRNRAELPLPQFRHFAGVPGFGEAVGYIHVAIGGT